MNIDDIKEYLKENENDEEVKRLLDSIADRRVSQARKTILEKDVPEMVEKELQKRLEIERENRDKAEKRATFENTLRERLSTYDVPEDLGMKFLESLDVSTAKEDIDKRFEELDNWITETKKKAIQEQFAGNGSPRRGEEQPTFDLESASVNDILANLETINRTV